MALKIARLDELYDGFRRVVRVNGLEVVLLPHKGEIVVFDARCPHQEFSLANGAIQGDSLICPRHGLRFNLLTGQCLQNSSCLTRYHWYYEGNTICLAL